MRRALSCEQAEELCIENGTDIDPYGTVQWSVGDEDDFICFDHAILNDGSVILGSVLNSESASFIENFIYTHAEAYEALAAAEEMLREAQHWCTLNGVDTEGSNGDEWLEELRSFLPAEQGLW